MSAKENRTQVRRYVEKVWNEHRLDLFADFVAKDVVHHGSPEILGRDHMKQTATMILNAFPDFHQTIDDEIAEGDKVVLRWTSKGTHQGDFLGMPATGKRAVWSGMSVFRVAGGRIVDLWVESDNMSMMQQLGAIPMPGQD